MNKKEQAEMDELKIKLALRFTEKVEPDVLPPTLEEGYNVLRKGFLFNSHSPRVEKSCTSSGFHSMGYDDQTTSRGSAKLYSTQILAWKAMRNEMEERFAKELRNIDIRIEKLLQDS